jgi:hypothetical protein
LVKLQAAGRSPKLPQPASAVAHVQPHIHVPTTRELASDFKSKVKLVQAEKVPCPDPISAWPFFEDWARIVPDRRMATLVAAMCDAGKQMEFEEALHG